MKTAHFTYHGDKRNFTLRSPYDPDFVEELKMQIPYQKRRWDGEKWTIHEDYFAKAHTLCEGYFDEVLVVDFEPSYDPSKDQQNAFEIFVRNLPEEVLREARRQAIKALHPDNGGDPKQAAALNAAWDWLKEELDL